MHKSSACPMLDQAMYLNALMVSCCMCVSLGFLTWLIRAAMCCCFAIGVLLCLQRPVRCRQYSISLLVVTQLPGTA